MDRVAGLQRAGDSTAKTRQRRRCDSGTRSGRDRDEIRFRSGWLDVREGRGKRHEGFSWWETCRRWRRNEGVCLIGLCVLEDFRTLKTQLQEVWRRHGGSIVSAALSLACLPARGRPRCTEEKLDQQENGSFGWASIKPAEPAGRNCKRTEDSTAVGNGVERFDGRPPQKTC